MDIDRIQELHSKLSSGIKVYELRLGSFPIEVLNEHRYALRAAVELLALANFDSVEGNDLERVKYAGERLHHAMLCAYHDLLDGLVIELTFALNECITEDPEATFRAMGSRQVEIIDAVNSATALVEASRSKPSERREYYQKLYSDHFNALADAWKFFQQEVIPEIAKSRIRKEEADKAKNTRIRTSAILGAIALISGIISVWFTG